MQTVLRVSLLSSIVVALCFVVAYSVGADVQAQRTGEFPKFWSWEQQDLDTSMRYRIMDAEIDSDGQYHAVRHQVEEFIGWPDTTLGAEYVTWDSGWATTHTLPAGEVVDLHLNESGEPNLLLYSFPTFYTFTEQISGTWTSFTATGPTPPPTGPTWPIQTVVNDEGFSRYYKSANGLFQWRARASMSQTMQIPTVCQDNNQDLEYFEVVEDGDGNANIAYTCEDGDSSALYVSSEIDGWESELITAEMADFKTQKIALDADNNVHVVYGIALGDGVDSSESYDITIYHWHKVGDNTANTLIAQESIFSSHPDGILAIASIQFTASGELHLIYNVISNVINSTYSQAVYLTSNEAGQTAYRIYDGSSSAGHSTGSFLLAHELDEQGTPLLLLSPYSIWTPSFGFARLEATAIEAQHLFLPVVAHP